MVFAYVRILNMNFVAFRAIVVCNIQFGISYDLCSFGVLQFCYLSFFELQLGRDLSYESIMGCMAVILALRISRL